MNIEKLIGKKGQIYLKEKGLLSSLRGLGEVIALQDGRFLQFKDNYNEILMTTKYMLNYLRKGIKDPARKEMYDSLRAKTVDLIGLIGRAQELRSDHNSYSDIARTLQYTGVSIDSIIDKYIKYSSLYSIMVESGIRDESLIKQREHVLNDLFEWTWTTLPLQQKDADKLHSLIKDSIESLTVKTLIISALLLSLLGRFDTIKFRLLLDIYDKSDSDAIAARAMVALILVMKEYGQITIYDKENRLRIESWQDSLLSYSRLRELEMALITAFDTAKSSSEFEKNIVNDIKKFQPKIREMMQGLDLQSKNPGDIAESIESLGFNPEWEKFMTDSGLDKKMIKMQKMIESGSDIFYSTFKNQKQYPFFRRLSNWFVPFEKYRSEINIDNSFIEKLISSSKNGVICDSDMYSLACSLSQISRMARGMSDKFTEEIGQMKNNESEIESEMKLFSTEARIYVKDLYRFFTLSPFPTSFENPFKEPVHPGQLPVIGETLFDTEFNRLVYEFLFRSGYYEMALHYLEPLTYQVDADYMIFQKAGYCHQQLGNYRQALDYYLRASLFDQDERWIKTAIGHIYFKLKEFESASKYFEEALKLNPDDKDLTLMTASSHLEAGHTNIALSHFYKMDYENPSVDSARGIAWGEFLRNDPLKGMEYFNRMINEEFPGKLLDSDYVRAGHIALSLGNISDANKCYLLPVNKSRSLYYEDFPVLEEKGVSKADFDLIIENVLWTEKWPELSEL
ncbi:MAG: tetratricopeptide repeat protein [Prevotella sp.]|nr:tetratricopeptide repeat protein [Bacteroides sp.]MCM1365639.1 tetratricopeptide repeat protein [Prevotella sp.]